MITLPIIILILFNHWLFDFVLQNEDMAKNKSFSNYHLGKHVGVYTLGLFFLSFVLFQGETWNGFGIIWIIVNAITHFVTDYVTSRATSALYKEQRFHEFFVIIGIDQFIHYITLFGTYVWLINQ